MKASQASVSSCRYQSKTVSNVGIHASCVFQLVATQAFLVLFSFTHWRSEKPIHTYMLFGKNQRMRRRAETCFFFFKRALLLVAFHWEFMDFSCGSLRWLLYRSISSLPLPLFNHILRYNMGAKFFYEGKTNKSRVTKKLLWGCDFSANQGCVSLRSELETT